MAIKRAKLRGLESNGMLCSARELGLGDEHDGIMELPASLPLNQDLREALDLDDTLFEVNATPNRGDCMSVFGIARDYAAAQERRYLAVRVAPVAARGASTFPVTLEAPDACPIFASRVIRGVKAGAASPAWLRERLRRVGINSISAIVDVTNYVMMDLGQPMHAYDLAKIREGIRVRQAKPEERITLLDDKEYVLDPEYLVIADASGAIGLAGIMGGRSTAISDSTTRRAVGVRALCARRHCGACAASWVVHRCGATLRTRRRSDPARASPSSGRRRCSSRSSGGEPGPVQVTRARRRRCAGLGELAPRPPGATARA